MSSNRKHKKGTNKTITEPPQSPQAVALQAQVAVLQAQVAALQAQVAALQANNVALQARNRELVVSALFEDSD